MFIKDKTLDRVMMVFAIFFVFAILLLLAAQGIESRQERINRLADEAIARSEESLSIYYGERR